MLASQRARTCAAVVSVAAGAAVLIGAAAVPGIGASPYGPDAAVVVGACALGLMGAGVLSAWAMAEPRTAMLVTIAGGLTGCGLLLQLLLYGAAPDALAAVDTTDVEPTAHPMPRATPLREDRAEEGLAPETALRNAPDPAGTTFRVPKVIEGGEA